MSSQPSCLVTGAPGLRLVSCLLVGCLLAGSPSARAELSVDGGTSVRILLDHSGSMFPGYLPPGAGGPTRDEAGGRLYVEYPEMAAWIDDLVRAQTVVGGETASLAAFASGPGFAAGDVRTLQPPVPLARFAFRPLVARLPEPGLQTYVAESLRQATRGFEGIVWVITDNIVESRGGVPDEDVRRFFAELASTPRYRSVHLYKLPFSRLVPGRPGHLAVYGIVVSPRAVPPATLLAFDNKFRGALLEAQRRSTGGALFAESAYWKLKDLSVGALALELRPLLDVEIVQQDRGLFRSRQIVRLKVVGNVASQLTQHRVVGGRMRLTPVGEFTPSQETTEAYGVQPIPGDVFEPFEVELPEIPPRRSVPFTAQLTSKRPLPLKTEGLGAWLRSASRGVPVTFRGQAQAYFTGLDAVFDAGQMEGIFGAEAAPEIFGVRARLDIDDEVSNREPVSFELTSSYGRMLLLALLLIVVVALLALLGWLFAVPLAFEMRLAGEESYLRLRRLAWRAIAYQGHELGRLRRGLTDQGSFSPNRDSAAVRVAPAGEEGRWEISVRGEPTRWLELRRVGGGPVPTASAPARDEAGARSAGPGRPGARPGSSNRSPSSRRPTIRRPGD